MTFTRSRTQREVAKAAGVSDMTVSRVLRGTGVVSERTRARVLKVVDEMGYVQNRLAGSLAASRANQVAVIIPSLVTNIFSQVAAGIAEELERAGYNPVIGISNYDMDREENLVNSMLSWRPAGFIVTDFVHTKRTRNILANAGIPVVEMMETSGEPIDMCVGFNHTESARIMAEHLLEKGYRRFGYLGWNNTDYAAATRYTVIKDRLAAEGIYLIAPEVFDQSPDFEAGKQAMAQLLKSHPELEVVIFSNDMSACGGMIYCLENGIDVPKQMAVAGFSGVKFGQSMPRALTTINAKRHEIGRRSARAVLNALAGQQQPSVVDVGFDLIAGNSS